LCRGLFRPVYSTDYPFVSSCSPHRVAAMQLLSTRGGKHRHRGTSTLQCTLILKRTRPGPPTGRFLKHALNPPGVHFRRAVIVKGRLLALPRWWMAVAQVCPAQPPALPALPERCHWNHGWTRLTRMRQRHDELLLLPAWSRRTVTRRSAGKPAFLRR
jgi:hypothetical protein